MKTPLYELHQTLGAKFTEFAGWSMPLQYQGIVAEHLAVRSRVGVFDVSHMAKWHIGDKAEPILQKLVTSDLSLVQSQQAIYTLCLNEQGGIMDDLILYRAQGGWYVITNAATYGKIKAWFSQHLGAQLQDLTHSQVLLAVQGRGAIPTVSQILDWDLSGLPRFHHLTHDQIFIARTGYTGEDGLEIMLAPDRALRLWQQLFDLGVTPCGLGCRDTLRLEAGLHLYGQDMDDTTTPYAAGLGWTVHLDKGEFIGRTALLSQTLPSHKLVGLRMTGRAIPRHGYPVYYEGAQVGHITSGTFAPSLNYPIAFAYVATPLAQTGQSVAVLIRDQLHSAIVSKRSFYKPLTNKW
ncbi:MAG: glycine cleavage system aminomethyltransferase GcvT [Pseudanabaenaceae cyanobacterium]